MAVGASATRRLRPDGAVRGVFDVGQGVMERVYDRPRVRNGTVALSRATRREASDRPKISY